MTLHVCQDGHKWYVQEDPEDETWIAEFSSEQAAEAYVKSLEEKKYTSAQRYQARSIFNEQMNDSSLDYGDFDGEEVENAVQEILEYHWDFKNFDERLTIATTEDSAIYRKIKDMSGMQGGQAENEILDGICKNSLDNQPIFDELESYLIPETHEAELMEEIEN